MDVCHVGHASDMQASRGGALFSSRTGPTHITVSVMELLVTFPSTNALHSQRHSRPYSTMLVAVHHASMMVGFASFCERSPQPWWLQHWAAAAVTVAPLSESSLHNSHKRDRCDYDALYSAQ